MTRRWWLGGLLVALVACMPERRSVEPSGATSNDVASDAGADAQVSDPDAADAQSSDASDTTRGPKGCTADEQCAALVDSECLEASCDLNSGLCVVKHSPDDSPCGDGSKCVKNERCLKGQCVSEAVDCDDGNLCTTDSCQEAVGCLNNANTDPCTDGDPCTGPDACSEGQCVGEAVKCPTSTDPCVVVSCVAAKGGCVTSPADLASSATVTCDDADPCTEGDKCVQGLCTGAPKACEDDGDSCTMEVCLNGKCLASPTMGMACDDGDPCTEMDACGPKAGAPTQAQCAGVKVNCDDGNPCTDDSCGSGGCETKANTAPCDDGDPCTKESSCEQKGCVGKGSVDCDDGFECTDDKCDSKAGGCKHTLANKKCDDGDVCTKDDTCVNKLQGGAICGGNKVVCDDKNPCTADACSSGKGCVYSTVKNGQSCQVTTGGGAGACWGGSCVAPSCGNNICETKEDAKTCAGDCPEGGGACAVNDSACVTQCRKDKCGAEAKACADEAKCPGTETCMTACSSDACRLKCAKDNPPAAVKAYHALGYCLSTKCLKNDWNGKPCTGSNATATCVDVCGAGVCPVERLDCFGVTECKAIVDCQAKCNVTDNVCPAACVKAQPKTAQDLFVVYDDCLSAKCK